jgi:hypothetical protein
MPRLFAENLACPLAAIARRTWHYLDLGVHAGEQ